MNEPLLAVEDLKVHFPSRKRLFRQSGAIRAVDGVSFTIAAREVVGLVGESGCGKTTLGRAIPIRAPSLPACRWSITRCGGRAGVSG